MHSVLLKPIFYLHERWYRRKIVSTLNIKPKLEYILSSITNDIRAIWQFHKLKVPKQLQISGSPRTLISKHQYFPPKINQEVSIGIRKRRANYMVLPENPCPLFSTEIEETI